MPCPHRQYQTLGQTPNTDRLRFLETFAEILRQSLNPRPEPLRNFLRLFVDRAQFQMPNLTILDDELAADKNTLYMGARHAENKMPR